jgi:hypothetical protein
MQISLAVTDILKKKKKKKKDFVVYFPDVQKELIMFSYVCK